MRNTEGHITPTATHILLPVPLCCPPQHRGRSISGDDTEGQGARCRCCGGCCGGCYIKTKSKGATDVCYRGSLNTEGHIYESLPVYSPILYELDF